MLRFPELLNQVWGLEGSSLFFTLCAQIVASGSALAGLTCYRLLVVIKCRVTRQLVCGCPFKGQPIDTKITRNFDSADKPRFTTQLLMCAA